MCMLDLKKLLKQIGMNTPQDLGLEIKQSLRQLQVKSRPNLLLMMELMMCMLDLKKLLKQIGMNTAQDLGLEIKQSLRQLHVKS